MKDPALLIIDVQRGFVNDHTAHVPHLVETLQHDYRVAYAVRFVLDTESLFAADLGMEPRDIKNERFAFEPAPHVRLYSKSGYSAADRRLLLELEAQEITEVHLCGMDTDACVMATAMALFDAGIRPVVLAHACASSGGPEAHTGALRLLARNIGENQIRREPARREQQ